MILLIHRTATLAGSDPVRCRRLSRMVLSLSRLARSVISLVQIAVYILSCVRDKVISFVADP